MVKYIKGKQAAQKNKDCRIFMNKYYFRPNLEVIKRLYLENAGIEYKMDEDIFNATLLVEAENEDICQQIRIGITDITMWEMFDSETGDSLPHNLKNPEHWQR